MPPKRKASKLSEEEKRTSKGSAPKQADVPERSNPGYSQDFLHLASGWYDDAASSDLLVQLQDEQTVHCHRLILCSWSDVWAAALQDKMQEHTLELTTFDPDTTKRCLQYCYTGRIALTDDNLTQVHRFALCYHLQGLQSFCETVMQSELSAKNCVALYSYLFESSIPGLSGPREAAKRMMCDNFTAASCEKSFCVLSASALCEILTWPIVEVNEDGILEACCRWIDHNKPTVDLQMQERVLQHVRFSQLSPKALIEFKSHEVMKQSVVVAEHYHLGVEWRMAELAGPDREALQRRLMQGNKNALISLASRGPQLDLSDSQILDRVMTKRLASMLGQSTSADLLYRGGREVLRNRPSFPFLCIIRDYEGHVFGACCLSETEGFLFSLKELGAQRVVKLDMTGAVCTVYWGMGFGLSVGSALIARNRTCATGEDSLVTLAAGFEGVATRTLHGRFGEFSPELVELHALRFPST